MGELNRRDFLRRAGIGAAAAWAIPVIQSVAATPAFAQSQGSPSGCFHSISLPDKPNGCMETCTGIAATGNAGSCQDVCGPACNLPNNGCPPQYCQSSCWQIDPTDSTGKRRIFVC